MKPQSTPKRNYMIYTLYDPNSKVAFLAKSYGDMAGLKSIVSKHVNHHNRYTAEYFGKQPPLVVPKLSVLERITGTYRDAYRHLIAWTRYFISRDFTMIMQSGTIQNAMELHPETEAIYNSIKSLPLETVLSQSDLISCSASKKHKPPDSSHKEQFNIRISSICKARFEELCEREGVTRDQAFSMLLNCSPYTNKNPASFDSEQVRLLKDRLAQQEAKLVAAQNRINKLDRLDDRYKTLPNTINQMTDLLFSILEDVYNPDYEKLKILKASARTLDWANFQYPSSPHGVMCVLLLGLVYVKGGTPGIFVLAQDVFTKKRLKFRYYRKNTYIGLPIHQSQWSYLSSLWVVSWQSSNDGARQLSGSIPVPNSKAPLTLAEIDAAGRVSSLDQLIEKATIT